MKKIKEAVIRDFSDADRIENFRLDKNGSLIKREGYTSVSGISGSVRGAICVGGVTYVLSENRLYSINGMAASLIGTLSSCAFTSSEDKAAMFTDLGILYIIGGGAYYTYNPLTGTLSETVGYAPLIRINATQNSTGVENEPRNLISSRVRMAFNPAGNTSKTFYLWGTVTEINAVYGNGVKYGTSSYRTTVNSSSSYITVISNSLSSCDEIIVEYTLDTTEHPIMKSEYLSGCSVHVHEEKNGRRLFLYGYDSPSDTGGLKGIVRITGNDAAGNARVDYIPEKSYFTVGDGFTAVRCIASLGSRTVIMTENMIYELSSGSTYNCEVVTPEMGICKSSGILLYYDELYFMSDRGLYRFAYNAETFEYYAIRIEFPDYAAPKPSEYEGLRLFLYRSKDEIWCCADGCVYVYSLTHKKWYTFRDLTVSGMVTGDEGAAFWSGSVFGVFSDEICTDNGVGFEAVFESKPIDVDTPYSRKTFFGFGISVDRYDSASVMCTLTGDNGEKAVISFTEDGSSTVSPAVMRTRLRLSDAKYVLCRITAPSGTVPVNVRSIMLRYREIGGAP